MNRQGKPPAAAVPGRKRGRPKKAAGSDGGTANAAAAAAGSSPPAPAKKQRVSGPKSKAGKEDAGDVLARDEPRGGVEATEEERSSKPFGGLFSKDLAYMMYAFGDANKPLKETVDLVEEIAVQYITDTVDAAMRAAAARSTGAGSYGGRKDELRMEDVVYAVRRDPRKVARAQELIRKQQEIDSARRIIDEDMPAKM